VTGIEANRERARDLMERSSALSTLWLRTWLRPGCGDLEAAVREGRTIREIVIERGIFTAEELDQLLAPHELTEPAWPATSTSRQAAEGYKPPTGPSRGRVGDRLVTWIPRTGFASELEASMERDPALRSLRHSRPNTTGPPHPA